MIPALKKVIFQKFKNFILSLTIALIFQPSFLLLDQMCNYLRFGESSTILEKILQSYLLFFILWKILTQRMKVDSGRHNLYGCLLQTLLLKYIFNQFFMERAKVIWLQISSNIQSKQDILFSSGIYLIAFAISVKAFIVFKDTTIKNKKEVNYEELEQI